MQPFPKLQVSLFNQVLLNDYADLSGSQDSMVFEAFLRLFVETTGHYTEYICTQQDGKFVFEVTLYMRKMSD